jgi:organic hydroperoxide reductase OsmC/OhrA
VQETPPGLGENGRMGVMEHTHRFRVVAWWSSGRTGIAVADSAPNGVHFTAPFQFGGIAGRWTPEDMLLGALAGCFTTTFQTVAQHSKFEYTDLEVETAGTLNKGEKGYSFSEITIRPRLTIASEDMRTRALDIVEKTHSLCVVSKALRIAPRLEVRVQVVNALTLT